MVSVSNSYINHTKKSLKSQGLNPQDCVTCFICKQNQSSEYVLNTIVYPLYLFDNNDEKVKLKMDQPSLYKKGGCWFASDTNSFFLLISKKITVNKKGEINVLKTPSEGKGSLIHFIGACLKEHAINKKLSYKELAANLDLSEYKLDKIFKGIYGKLDLKNLIRISMEFEGHGNLTKRFVMLEKIVSQKQNFEYDYGLDFDE